jgi:SNF2-related domain
MHYIERARPFDMDALYVSKEGQLLVGPLFNEPMLVEAVRPGAAAVWTVGLVGSRTHQFRRVQLSEGELALLRVVEATRFFTGDPQLLKLAVQAYALGIAYEFDPYFGLSISRVDPLPHQLEAVYDYLLKVPRVRFLLADDAGAGKTIMAGLLIRELKLRGLCERIAIVCPANLTFQWRREMRDKFEEKFEVLRGSDIREQYGVNQWIEHPQVITSLDLAKRTDVLPGLRQVHWNLVIVDEAHRMSASDPEHKTQRYRLGELLRDAKFRTPVASDLRAFAAVQETDALFRTSKYDDATSVYPNESLNPVRPSPNARGLSAVTRYGMTTFSDCYLPRQRAVLSEVVKFIRGYDFNRSDLHAAVGRCLLIILGRCVDRWSSCCRLDSSRDTVTGSFSKQALQLVWDFCEANPFPSGLVALQMQPNGSQRQLRTLQLAFRTLARYISATPVHSHFPTRAPASGLPILHIMTRCHMPTWQIFFIVG